MLIFLFSHQAICACPDWIKKRSTSLPECPSDNTILPEIFPTAAVVVSDRGFLDDPSFTPSFVEKVLNSSTKNIPLIVLPVSDNTISRIKNHIDSLNISPQQKKQWKSKLIQVPAQSYTWQQDYFEAFVDQSGQPVLRPVEGYPRVGGFLEKIAKATQECGFKLGAPLKTGSLKNGHMGGNIEGFPGGFCLLGDDHFKNHQEWSDYTRQFCGSNLENKIKVPTNWLFIGHTDEIMKVVKNNNLKAPCNFSIALASPRKAIELLKIAPTKSFLEFPKNRTHSGKGLAISRSKVHRGLKKLCKVISNLSDKYNSPDSPIKPKGVTEYYFQIINFLVNSAHAQLSYKKKHKQIDCSEITNHQVLKALSENDSLKIYNELIQQKMDNLKSKLKLKLQERLPQCKPDFIEVPDLFFGGEPVHLKNSKYELPQGMGLSILPNPTNSVSIGNTVITPEPGNSLFKKYIATEYTQRGIKPDFVDTFDYAHMGRGNLHCATHTIHICKLREKK